MVETLERKKRALQAWIFASRLLTNRSHNPHPNRFVQEAILAGLHRAEQQAWAEFRSASEAVDACAQ